MSFVIQYVNGQLGQYNIRTKTTPSPLYVSHDSNMLLMGEIFNASPEDVFKSNWQESPKVLEHFDGAFALLEFSQDVCIFVTDNGGIETFHYYHDKNIFIISDDFWEIVKIIKPNYEDIDVDSMKEIIVARSTILDTNTIIKNLKITQPSTIGTFIPSENKLKMKKYKDFVLEKKVTDVNEAVDNMDEILNRAMLEIKNKCGDALYGLGLSGGLDSRIIPYYALKNNLKISAFNICVKRPNHFFVARSCKSSKSIAKRFNIPYKNVEWKGHNLRDIIYEKIKRAPMLPFGDIFKFAYSGVPDFDVLLTGSFGYIVGADLPNNVSTMSREELLDALKGQFFRKKEVSLIESRTSRALEYLFNVKYKPKINNQKQQSLFYKLINDKDWSKINFKLEKFVDSRILKGRNNIEIFEDYFTNVLGFLSAQGAFESFWGKKRSFSIYIPFLLKETLSWAPELLIDRLVLNELIKQKIPQVADIKTESFNGAPDTLKNSGVLAFLYRILSLSMFIFRGNGTNIAEHHFNKKYAYKEFINDMNNPTNWFYDIFDIKDDIDEFLKGPYNLAIEIWGLKKLLDIIETKQYVEF